MKSEEINISEIQEPVIDTPTMQEQTLMSLSMMIMNSLSAETPRQFTRIYQYVKILAKRLNEEKIEKELDKLYENTPVRQQLNLPLYILQYIYDKDSYMGYSPMKNYLINLSDEKKETLTAINYFHPLLKKKITKKTQICLSDIITALDRVKIKLIDYYTLMAIKHNIEIQPIQPPEISGESMPSL